MKKLRAQGMLTIIQCKVLLSSSLLSKNIKITIYRNITLCYFVLAWNLREEHKLWVFENGVLRRIFGQKTDEVTEEWRRLHNEEHYDLYSRPIIIGVIKSRRIWLSRHVACISFTIVAQWVLVEKAEEKRSLGRPRRRWENNIKLDLKEVWWMA